MTYLLDTHVLLWWIGQPEILPQSLLALLEDLNNQLLLSIASPWELAIKMNSGKLNARQILRDLEAGKLEDSIGWVPTQVGHVIRAGLLPLHHRDPFDRLIVAQALELHVPVVSQDRVFELYGVKRIWE